MQYGVVLSITIMQYAVKPLEKHVFHISEVSCCIVNTTRDTTPATPCCIVLHSYNTTCNTTRNTTCNTTYNTPYLSSCSIVFLYSCMWSAIAGFRYGLAAIFFVPISTSLVIVEAFYPLLLIISYEVGVHHHPLGCRTLLEGLLLA